MGIETLAALAGGGASLIGSGLDYKQQKAALKQAEEDRAANIGLIQQYGGNDSINYGALQAQRVPVNFNALTGITSPETLDYANFQVPEYGSSSNTQAQSNWTDGSARSYLNANPDIEMNYNQMRPQLLAGGDPQFATIEGYATWHYDNYGKQEGRPLTPTQSASTTAVFNPEQVRNAISRMGGPEL